jgi:hypothetical protein
MDNEAPSVVARQQSRSFAPLHCCNFWLAQGKRSLSRYRIVNRNWVTYFGIFLVLFCCTPAQLKSGGDGGYGESSYRVLSGTTDTERVFDRMIEQRDIKLAIRALVGQGFTSGEIEEAVQNRLLRIRGWHFPGDFCSASGKIGEPGEGTVVGPTYYLIIGRARILRWIREVGSN